MQRSILRPFSGNAVERGPLDAELCADFAPVPAVECRPHSVVACGDLMRVDRGIMAVDVDCLPTDAAPDFFHDGRYQKLSGWASDDIEQFLMQAGVAGAETYRILFSHSALA